MGASRIQRGTPADLEPTLLTVRVFEAVLEFNLVRTINRHELMQRIADPLPIVVVDTAEVRSEVWGEAILDAGQLRECFR